MEEIRTKQDLMRHIDAKLTPEERQQLLQVTDPLDLHFGFGTWIRNQYIYDNDDIDVAAIYYPEEQFVLYHADELSEQIIEDFLKYLHGETIESQEPTVDFAVRIAMP